MWELGFTNGCATGQYCQEITADDGAIAVFGVRARLAGDNFYTSNGAATDDTFSYSTGQQFVDIPSSHPDLKWVQKAFDFGAVVSQVGMLERSAYTYCTTSAAFRGQMASFVEVAHTRLLGVGCLSTLRILEKPDKCI